MAKANPFFDFDPAKMPEFAKLPDYSKMLSDLKLPDRKSTRLNSSH